MPPEIDSHSLDEARTLVGPMVYALFDHKGTFYVGRTRNPARRFYQHKTFTGPNIYLAKRLRESGASVRVRVIAKDPPDLVSAEIDAIRQYSPTIINFHANPGRLPSGASGTKTCLCPQCGLAIDRPRQKFCSSCTMKLLNKCGASKQSLRDLAREAVKSFNGKP